MRFATPAAVAAAGILLIATGSLSPTAIAGFNAGTRINVADGRCDVNGAEKASFLCDITDGGTVVEAVTGSDGSFPQVRNGRAYFIYRVTDDGQGASPSHIDFELPICDPNHGQPNLVKLLNRDLSGPGGVEIHDREPSTGLMFPNAKVLKLDSGLSSGGSNTYTIVFNSSSISPELIDYAIKSGTGIEYGGMGILGAGCRKVSQDFWKQCKSQAVVNETGDTIYESEFKSLIRNTGDVALNNPRIQEYNTNLSCKITAVNGLVTDPAEPIPNMGEGFVRVPKNARFDGVLSPATIGSEKGEAVTIGIRCEHRQPNLVNTLNSKVETADGFMLVGRAYSNMGVQCPIRKELDIAIYKSCDGSHPGERLMAMDGYLVVEICPRIRVHNKGTQALHDVTVFDDLIGSLSDGLDIGTVPAGRIVDLGRDLDVDTCYMPSAPNEPPVGDHGTPSDPSDDKYDPETATFTNTAVVRARSGSGLQIYDAGSATCSLADKGVPDQN